MTHKEKSGAMCRGFAKPVPANIQISTMQTIFRRSDGAELGIITEFDNGGSSCMRHTNFRDGGSLTSEYDRFENADDGLAWIAANPHLPDITQDDKDVVRLNGNLLRRICSLPGDTFLCRQYRSNIFVLNAYRGEQRIAYVYPSGRGFRLTIIGFPKNDIIWKPTLQQAWTALIRAAMPQDTSGHELMLWNEALKTEKRRIRNEPDYPACLLEDARGGA